MKQKTYLPGKLCDRVRDLREEWGLTRKDLAERSGVDESLLGRIENNKNKKVSDEAVQALAKFFSVSTDFLLGLTDIPDRKNYDIEELGLSIQAARNLYTGVVNVQVVNLLLEDPQFAVLSNHVADFFDETMAAGYAARNQLYASISEVVGRIGKEDARQLADLIDAKAMTDVREKLETLPIDDKARAFFEHLPLFNGEDALQEALKYSFAPSLKQEAERFVKLAEDLNTLGYQDRFAFDLGKVPHLDYYTGIIFEGFVPGIGTAVLSGGRYDDLLKKVGRDMPAIGFGVKVDYLLDAVKEETETKRQLAYPQKCLIEALQYARVLRKEGPLELVRDDTIDKPEVR